MRKLFTLVFLIIGGLFGFITNAQEQSDRYAEITNPKLLQINREDPRATFYSFSNLKDALNATYTTKGSNVILLNGNWKFQYTDWFNERPNEGFQRNDFDDSEWNDIHVPGNWELQGFGTPIYVNHPYEFASPGHPPYWDKPNPPFVPEEFNPTGTYRKMFTLPEDWHEKELIL